jgi:hypothetical protein
MAEKAAGAARPTGGGSRIPRDAFISRVVPDPANPDADAPHVLRGYVGDSDEPGYSRIYCGPGLDLWGDVRDEDILHFEQATDGGEHTLYAKPGAQVKWGRRGAAKSQASSFVEGPLLSDYGGGAGGTGPIGITGWLGCGQATHLIGCTGYLGCVPHTHLLGCPRTSTCPPTGGYGCPNTSTCPPTGGYGCPSTSTCPPGGGLHPQALAAAAPTNMPGCPNTSTCTPETNLLGCPSTSTCPPQGDVALQSTAATLCTRYNCYPHITLATVCTQLCYTHYRCPPQNTAATLCTHYGCPGPATYQAGCTLGFTCTYVGCPY